MRQAAQRKLRLQLAMPIPEGVAKHSDGVWGNMKAINDACDRWLKKRGLSYQQFNTFGSGKPKQEKRP